MRFYCALAVSATIRVILTKIRIVAESPSSGMGGGVNGDHSLYKIVFSPTRMLELFQNCVFAHAYVGVVPNCVFAHAYVGIVLNHFIVIVSFDHASSISL